MTQAELIHMAENMLGIKILKQHCQLNSVLHNKTKKWYYVTGVCWNCTNKDDNTIMIIYQNADGQVFCREISEFLQKFTIHKDTEEYKNAIK